MPYPTCTCVLKLDPKDPIFLVESKNKSATYKPLYDTDPKCDPHDECLKRIKYKWTIEPTDGPSKLSDDDKEVCKVTGRGEFKLCLKIVVKCWIKISEDAPRDPDLTTVFRLSSQCRDEGCAEFMIA